MSVKDTGVIQIQNKPKITKIYARVTETEIYGVVFEYADGTRSSFVGPPNAAGSTNVDPTSIIDTVCEKIPGVTPYGIQYCNSLKNSGAVQTVFTPDGFDRLEWGYYNNPTQYGYSMTDLNFYKNKQLIGTIMNTLSRRGNVRRDLGLPEGHIANGMSVHTYSYGDYWPYNVIDAIYGMEDPNAVPINGGWSSWTDWGSCSTTCGPGIKQRTRECSNPYPSLGGSDCIGSASDASACNLADCPVDGGWGDWGDWSECIKNADGIPMQEQKRLCSNPAPNSLGKKCTGASSQLRLCVLSQAPAEVSRVSTVSESGVVQAQEVHPLDQLSVASSEEPSISWGLWLILALVILAVLGFAWSRMSNASGGSAKYSDILSEIYGY